MSGFLRSGFGHTAAAAVATSVFRVSQHITTVHMAGSPRSWRDKVAPDKMTRNKQSHSILVLFIIGSINREIHRISHIWKKSV